MTGILERAVVLVVDDAPDTLAFLTQALEVAGMRVMIAVDGTAALRAAARVAPDIVLLDAVMPGLDGFAVCRHLKMMTGFDVVPVLFMTGLSEPQDTVRGFEAGGADYVTKPVAIQPLIARMRVHLQNARRLKSAKNALDATDQFLVATSASGEVRWFTPQAYRLLEPHLEQHQDDGSLWLPTTVTDRLRTRIDAQGLGHRDLADGLRIAFVRATDDDEILFRLSQRSETGDAQRLGERFRLTSREAEVAAWIAKGKSNRDIADILSLSPRTVEKHLEVVLAKLNVENRTAAAALVLETMRGPG